MNMSGSFLYCKREQNQLSETADNTAWAITTIFPFPWFHADATGLLRNRFREEFCQKNERSSCSGCWSPAAALTQINADDIHGKMQVQTLKEDHWEEPGGVWLLTRADEISSSSCRQSSKKSWIDAGMLSASPVFIFARYNLCSLFSGCLTSSFSLAAV